MSKNERLGLIRKTLADLRETRRIGAGAAQWGTEADLEYLLACYDSIKAQYDGLMARPQSHASLDDLREAREIIGQLIVSECNCSWCERRREFLKRTAEGGEHG